MLEFIKCVPLCLLFSVYFCALITDPSSMTLSPSLQSREASALLKWKESLDSQSQTSLSSWSGNNSCNWLGGSCNEDSMSVSIVNLTNMRLKGTLQSFNFSSLPNIVTFDLRGNLLDGIIPPTIGKLLEINNLLLNDNNLSGSIPKEIGMMRSIIYIDLSNNNLTGKIPDAIGNLSHLGYLGFAVNHLSGTIPIEMCILGNLETFNVYDNNLSGKIPAAIGNLSHLRYLGFGGNHLSGTIPIEMNILGNLETFSVFDNNFTGQFPQNICVGANLKNIGAYNNHFIGRVLRSLKNCSSLIRLRLENNHFEENITDFFGVNPNLKFMGLDDNNFYGHLSSNLGKFHNLTDLHISQNHISGCIPSELSKATNLYSIDLSSNQLTGNIPKDLGNLTKLGRLFLRNNHLSGNVHVKIASLKELEILDVAANNLSGFITKELVSLSKLFNLSLSHNKFIGNIPDEFGEFQSLQSLDLSRNILNGTIPPMLGKMKFLETLNISHNNFSGFIPSSFDQMVSLTFVDISYNQLKGPLPNMRAFNNATIEVLRNNTDLCGNVFGLKPCSGYPNHKTKNLILLIVLPLAPGTLMLAFVCFKFSKYLCRMRTTRDNQDGGIIVAPNNVFTIWSFDGKMVYENIIEATEEFHDKYLIGVGTHGSVYKAELHTGQIVAVKKIHLATNRENSNIRCFTSGIQALTEIRHRNIVKLYGFCSHSHVPFLVYEFMEKGSLEKILKDDEQAIEFDWNKRVNVIKDVANALCYMHHDCFPPIVHRDISSKNILMDLEYVARVSDFGTAKLLNPNSANWTSFVGTFGYSAPELAYTMEVNEKCDVYSFGVLALEILHGKQPGDIISNSIQWNNMAGSKLDTMSLMDMLDQRLPRPMNTKAKQLLSVTKTLLSCLDESPRSRPTMEQVSMEISIS
ncbi:MDIS1-interacting receptor like kinase 2-like [Vicia villosa]|uniref:MDIS1-interacting receptor like kinase 2-like n=1 Tax=Vicia villosa TaxID=3911 RepID=UPI00273B44DB|nr:MDIS1-interacting receptor like kinase 2-like [Vicia villosa]